VHATLEAKLPMPPTPSEQRFRPLRRVEYDQLVELGAFQGEHIELLEGVLVPMSPIGPPHGSSIQKLNALLVPVLAGRAAVRIQSPFAALELSEPEPDVTVVPLGEYADAHPDRAHLIIEVAESSLSVDRGIKQRLYAACGVPEYWIVNLVERRLEVHRQPTGSRYGSRAVLEAGATVTPIAAGGANGPVSDLLV
jgi:Uma2 family endonuclease